MREQSSFGGSQVVVIVTVGLLLGMAVGGVGVAIAQQSTPTGNVSSGNNTVSVSKPSTTANGTLAAKNSSKTKQAKKTLKIARKLANMSDEESKEFIKKYPKKKKLMVEALTSENITQPEETFVSNPNGMAKYLLHKTDYGGDAPERDGSGLSYVDAPDLPDINPVKWVQDIIMAGFNAFTSAVAGLVNDFNWLIVSLPAPGQPFDPSSWYPSVASVFGGGGGGTSNSGPSSPTPGSNGTTAASAPASPQNGPSPNPDSLVIAAPGGGDGAGGNSTGGNATNATNGTTSFVSPHSGPLNLDGWWMVTWGIYAVLGVLCIIPLGIEGIVTWTRSDLTPRERGTRLREIGKGIGTIILLPVLVPAVLHAANLFAIGIAPSGQEFMSTYGGATKLTIGLILGVVLLAIESVIILFALFVLFVQWVLVFFVVATGPIYVWGVKSGSDMTHSIGKLGWTAFWGLIALKCFQALWLRWLFSLPLNFSTGGLLAILAIIVGLAVAFIGLPIKGTEKILPRVVVGAGRSTNKRTGDVGDVRSIIARRSGGDDE